MIVHFRSRRDSLLSGSILFCILVSILAVISFVTFPDIVDASGPGGHSPGGIRPPAGGGGHRGGGGFGFGIGIQLAPRIDPAAQEPNWDKIEKDMKGAAPATTTDGGTTKTRAVAKEPAYVAPARKLTKPRVPYLTELAIDIDKTLMDLAWNEPVKAIQLYKSALAQAKKKGDVQGEREALTNLAHVYYLTGRFARAAETYEEAFAISRKLKDMTEEAAARRNLAAVFVAWGQYDQAEEQNVEALKKFTDAANSRGIQMVLNNQGVLEKNRGRFIPAMEAYSLALEADKERGKMLALTLNNIGSFAKNWGQYKTAVESYNKALEVARKTGDSKTEAEGLLNIGLVYADQERYEQALENSQKALELFAKIGAPTDRAKKIVGDLYLELGKLDLAEPILKEAEYDSSLGRLYLMKSDPDSAKKHYEMLLAASQKEGNLDELFTAYTGLGRAFEAGKNYKQAETNYSKGMDVTEEIRSTLLLSERKNFFAIKVNGFSRSEPAKGLIRVTLKQNKPAQSVLPSESSRAREFADTLSQKLDGTFFNLPKTILVKEADIANKLASIKTASAIIPKGLDAERFAEISKQIKSLETERNSFIQGLWRDHKDYAAAKYPKPIKLEEASIGPDEYIIAYDLLGEGLGVKVIKGKKIVDSFFTEWNVRELEADVAKFRRSFEAADLEAFDPTRASTLYKKLLARPLEKIPAGSSITILPEGVLALLPFETLVVSGRAEWKKGQWGNRPEGLTYVGDLYPITYYQSLTAMTLVRALGKKKKSGDRVLVVADPVFDMSDVRAQAAEPETRVAHGRERLSNILMAAIEEESGGLFKLPRLSRTSDFARNMENIYGPTCDAYTGLQSNKIALMSKVAPNMDRYKSVVFATHGFASNQIPGIMEPVLALTMVPHGTDGYLTMSEVAGMKMNADVAALTACQTGTGVKLAGEGIMSMGRAFQCAGAKSVVMSLWSVAEDSSVIMMEEFFKGLKMGKSKREAWTNARIEVRKAGFDHPFFWGAFILVGEAD